MYDVEHFINIIALEGMSKNIKLFNEHGCIMLFIYL